MQNTLKIYLDLNHWITLAKANTGHPSGQQYKSILFYLFKKSKEGSITFPLSSTHYMELANIKDYRQRKDLANVMSALSGFKTLSAKKPIQTAEIENALNKIFGVPSGPRIINPSGLGCFFSFTGESKVLQLQGPQEGIQKIEFILGGKERFDEWKTKIVYDSEMLLLNGGSDEFIAKLKTEYTYRPEAATEIAQQRAIQEQELAAILANDPSLKMKIEDIVLARYLYYEMCDNLIEILYKNGLRMQDLLRLGKEKITSFIFDVPTAHVATSLLKANFKSLNRPWERNDIYDLDAITIAVPYCDVVVTDKHVAAQLNKEKIGEKYSTIILPKLDDLINFIDKF